MLRIAAQTLTEQRLTSFTSFTCCSKEFHKFHANTKEFQDELWLSFTPGPSNVPKISASPVNRLVFGIRTFFFGLVLFFGPRAVFGGMRAIRSYYMTYSSRNCVQKRPQRPAKRAQKPANERKFEKCPIENVNLGHFTIARAEIEESGTNSVFEQKKKRAKKGINGRSRQVSHVWAALEGTQPQTATLPSAMPKLRSK